MIRNLTQALSTWAPGDPAAVTWFLPELRKLLRSEFAGAYRPVATETGWSLDFMHGAGASAQAHSASFRSFVSKLSPSETFLGHSNPHFVQREQRNRVMRLGDLARFNSDPPYQALYQTLGILGHDQLRVLICDGPVQLSWVGATRKDPFTEREATLLRRVTRPLQHRLRFERQIGAPGLPPAMFEAALEALGAAAFVMNPRRSIEMMNSAARVLLERDRQTVLDSISHSEQQPDTAEFSITRVNVLGWPAHILAIRKKPCEVIERVLLAQRIWGLSIRQTRVLELVTQGSSNKEIALKLACAEVTIENHITELFRRSGAKTRAGLVGKLLTLG